MAETQQYLKKPISPGSIFSTEAIHNLSTLGDVLRQIRVRLHSEGISIEEARQKLLRSYEVQKSK